VSIIVTLKWHSKHVQLWRIGSTLAAAAAVQQVFVWGADRVLTICRRQQQAYATEPGEHIPAVARLGVNLTPCDGVADA
jgi:hypothetical protein